MFTCPRCGNKDPKFIGFLNNEPYCRKCILFYGEKAPRHTNEGNLVTLDLNYRLTKDQNHISKQLLQNFKNHIDSLVNAVCGAGKTELVFKTIAYALSLKKTVGFAIPRRDVVIELFLRLKSAFSSNTVIAVYGGSTSKLDADIVVLTTHQLYRYENYFDLLILDEIDAFPFKGNSLLYKMFEQAVKGNSILMSATPSKELLETYRENGKDILELNTRFHKHPLPIPKLVRQPEITIRSCLCKTLNKFIEEEKPCLVFVPTIFECEDLYDYLKNKIPGGYYLHSKSPYRVNTIRRFKANKYKYLITTAVLERGMTFANLQVVVFHANHELYNEQTLIQIAGRAGRKANAPEGEVIFIATKITNAMEDAKRTIESKNRFL